jgi:hypothetical protein
VNEPPVRPWDSPDYVSHWFSEAWRWLEVQEFLESGKDPSSRERPDRWITAACVATGKLDPEALQVDGQLLVSVKVAIELYETRSLQRDLLEARLLAQETADEIEQRSGIPMHVQEAYEMLFFDIRPMLSASSWINIRAIRLPVSYSEKPTLGAVLRSYGYGGGPLVLEAAVDVVQRYELDRPTVDFNKLHPASERDALVLRSLRLDLLPGTAGLSELLPVMGIAPPSPVDEQVAKRSKVPRA